MTVTVFGYLVPVVQRLDNAIWRLNRYPLDKCSQNKPRYPLDSDLLNNPDLILIGIDFTIVFLLSLVSIEKICHTLKTVSDHISKHLEVRQNYSGTLFSVFWNCGQTRSFVFDIFVI